MIIGIFGSVIADFEHSETNLGLADEDITSMKNVVLAQFSSHLLIETRLGVIRTLKTGKIKAGKLKVCIFGTSI